MNGQSRMDSIADADTFNRVLGICYPTSREAFSAAYHAAWCGLWALRTDTADDRDAAEHAYEYGYRAASAAFRAVPGLR